MTPLFARLTVAGVGLIGGSLALAAREAGLVGEVVGFGRSESNLQLARERGIVDRFEREPAAAVAGAASSTASARARRWPRPSGRTWVHARSSPTSAA